MTRTVTEIARSVVPGQTIMVKQHIMDKFYNSLGTTEEKVKKLSDERLDKLAGGWFLATFNQTLGEHRDVTTNFFIPNQYHVIEVNDDHIRIGIYPNFKKGYEELSKSGAEAYRNLVNNIKLTWEDFYVMGHAF